jgi:hypothetical protein
MGRQLFAMGLVVVFGFISFPASTNAAIFARPLSIGSKGADVSALQQFLKDQTYFTYPTITGYFGLATQTAVKAFQSAHNIVSSGTPETTGYGRVGPLTRALLTQLSSTTTTPIVSATSTTTTSKSNTVATSTSGSISNTDCPVTGDLSCIPGTAVIQPAPPGNAYSPGFGGGGTPNYTVARTPNAGISVAPSSATDDSGTNLVYTATLDQAVTSGTSVNFSVSGTAIPGTDFTAVTSPVVIPAGQTTGTITFTPISHTTIEEDRTLTVTLRAGTGYTVAAPTSATAIITNDDVQTGHFLYLGWDGTQFIDEGGGSGYELLNPVTPMTIVNTDTSTPLNVIFVGDFTFDSLNDYIVAGSDNIRFGSQTLDSNGNPTTITISHVTNYPGFITASGYSNIVIQNIFINSDSSTIAQSGGWFLRNGSENVTVLNSGSNGPININGGGIVGRNASNVTVSGGYSTGVIAGDGGGIVGGNAENVTVSDSRSSGTLKINAGGIFGNGACSNTTGSLCTVTNSYSTGAIGGSLASQYNAGGIFGANACLGSTGSTCSVTNSYSTGDIYGDNSGANGGIFGANAFASSVTNSHSTGGIGQGSGGIFQSGDSLSAENSYSTGNIGMYAGGIFGDGVTNSTATNTYSWGQIAENAGGIFGANVSGSLATNSYSIGIYPAGGGGMFGASSVSDTASNCYIFGSDIFGDSPTGQTISNCFTEDSLTWNDVDANSALIGSAGWTSTAPNTPFEFATTTISFNTPYSAVSVNDDGSLNNIFSQTVEKGGSTVSALSGYTTFSIVSESGGSSSSYADITIDPTTGVISTTDGVAGGTYDIVVGYNNPEGVYSTSVFHLTVND